MNLSTMYNDKVFTWETLKTDSVRNLVADSTRYLAKHLWKAAKIWTKFLRTSTNVYKFCMKSELFRVASILVGLDLDSGHLAVVLSASSLLITLPGFAIQPCHYHVQLAIDWG